MWSGLWEDFVDLRWVLKNNCQSNSGREILWVEGPHVPEKVLHRERGALWPRGLELKCPGQRRGGEDAAGSTQGRLSRVRPVRVLSLEWHSS